MNIGIQPSVNTAIQKRNCKAGDKRLFPHHKVDEQPNNKPKKGYHSKKRRESDDKNAVAIVKIEHNWVASRKTPRGKQSWRSPMQRSLGTDSKSTIHSVYATSSMVSGKAKDHRWEKCKSKFPHQRSPYAVKFEDRSHEETERQQRCARSKAWNLSKKHTQAQRE